MAAPTPEQVAAVAKWLGSNSKWDDAAIIEHWTGGIASTLRAYWYNRVTETAGYIDLSNDGLPASQIYQHAKEMLDYWDNFLAKYGDIDPGKIARVPISFGKIRNRYARSNADC